MVSKEYFVCKVAQRGAASPVTFAVLVATAKDVNSWAGVRRVGEHEKGTQRILKPARWRAIERFLQTDQRNTLPTSIMVAFDPDTVVFNSTQSKFADCFDEIDTSNGVSDKIEWGVLSFEFDETLDESRRPAIVVDGQHRLRGMAKLDENIPILVVALINASHEEQAFQFVVINNKSAKVPTDSVKAIVTSINESELQERLLRAGVDYADKLAILRDLDEDTASPFYKLFDWPLNRTENHLIKLTTIENCLRYLRSRFTVLEDDDETLRDMFKNIWRAILENYPELWISSSKFMSKVNITALNEFIADRLSYAYEGDLLDIFEDDKVVAQTTSIVRSIPSRFWTEKWAFDLQDNAVLRNMIKEDLRTMSQNRRAKKFWNEKLKLVPQDSETDTGEEHI